MAVLLSGREKFSAYSGGALARWTYEVYRQLLDDVDVVAFGYPTPAEQRYQLPHTTSPSWILCDVVARIPFARRYREVLWLAALAKKLRRFDLIHIHNRPQWAFLLRDAGFPGKIVVHLQNDHLGHWTSPMLDRLAGVVDAVLVCSTYLRNTFAPRSAAVAARTHIVFNGVNTDLFHPREDLREPATILFAGRFDAEKGVLQLVEAFAKVRQTYPNAKLIVVGTTGFGTHRDSEYVRGVYATAKIIAGDRNDVIQFAGYVHHDRDLPLYFQRATVFTSPSLFQEPFGLVNAEAMACATPVVGSNRGGIPEVLGPAGSFVDPTDADGYSRTLSALLDDPNQRRELGRISRERACSLFAWPVIAGQWMELMTEILAGRQTAPSQEQAVAV